jgi:hypothetical protein
VKRPCIDGYVVVPTGLMGCVGRVLPRNDLSASEQLRCGGSGRHRGSSGGAARRRLEAMFPRRAHMGIRTDMMSGGEAPVAGFDRDALPNVAPEDVEGQRGRAFVASGLGWALDGSTGRFFFALPAMTAAIGLVALGLPVVLAASLVASASGGQVAGTLAPPLRPRACADVRDPPYALFDLALPAGVRKGRPVRTPRPPGAWLVRAGAGPPFRRREPFRVVPAITAPTVNYKEREDR